jgi:hypothetical protein
MFAVCCALGAPVMLPARSCSVARDEGIVPSSIRRRLRSVRWWSGSSIVTTSRRSSASVAAWVASPNGSLSANAGHRDEALLSADCFRGCARDVSCTRVDDHRMDFMSKSTI